MSCGTTIRVLFSRALSHPKHSRPWLCRGRGCRGGKGGEDSHCKFNAGWKTGRPWLDFRQVATTTTDLDSPGNSVIVTAMFCKWCEMDGFKHNNRGKPGANLQCGRTLAGGARGRSWSMSRITRALCVCMQQGRYIAHKFESGWEVGVIKAFDEGPSRWKVQREVQG